MLSGDICLAPLTVTVTSVTSCLIGRCYLSAALGQKTVRKFQGSLFYPVQERLLQHPCQMIIHHFCLNTSNNRSLSTFVKQSQKQLTAQKNQRTVLLILSRQNIFLCWQFEERIFILLCHGAENNGEIFLSMTYFLCFSLLLAFILITLLPSLPRR